MQRGWSADGRCRPSPWPSPWEGEGTEAARDQGRSSRLGKFLTLLLGLGLLGVGLLAEAGVAGAGELALELLDAAGRVDELQLAGIEGMAGAADIELQLLAGAARGKAVAATAGNLGLVVSGMDVGFHSDDSWNGSNREFYRPAGGGTRAAGDKVIGDRLLVIGGWRELAGLSRSP